MRYNKGFTLVEVLIVVVILGILAAVAMPVFSNASEAARASMLADDLRVMRMQIAWFKMQHLSIPPGYPGDRNGTPTSELFVAHLTQASRANFQTAPPGTDGYDLGPYMREVPRNPVNDKNTVQVIANDEALPAEADDSHGWVYKPATLTFKADSAGVDEDGKAYFDY